MKVRLSHIAIACPGIERVADRLNKALSLRVTEQHDVPTEKVRAAMIPIHVSEGVRIELLEPTAPDSPISKFLAKRTEGGIHHLSFEVEDLERWQEALMRARIEVLPPGIRKAARGRALFIHPQSMGGVLVELCEELSSSSSKGN